MKLNHPQKILIFKIIFLLNILFLSPNNSFAIERNANSNLRDLAKSGNLEAQKKLAYEYFMGKKRQRNYNLAVYWFKKAAAQNDAFAKFNLAVCYSKGYGVKENKYQSFLLCKEAAKTIPDAKYMLANFYETGISPVNANKKKFLNPDFKKAITLYKELLSQNNYKEARYSLAKLLLKIPNGTEADKAYAIKLLNEAIKNKDSYAMNFLADCYYAGNGVPQSFKKMFYWLKQSSLLNNNHAIARLAYCYWHGYGTKRNRKLAFKLFKHAAKAHEPMAMNQMGDFYATGEFVEENLATAIEWYKKAAEEKNTQAIFTLGSFYVKGIYFKKAIEKASRLFHQAALLNHSQAQYEFALMLLAGAGVKTNFNLAFYWFEKSALNDHAPAQRELANCYIKGIGTLKNQEKAIFWLKKAAKNGDKKAKDIYRQLSNLKK